MNNISLISVAELLDGRYFFIPAYQRGYRWGKDQMWELLDDLYEFSIRKKEDGEFYCLQPVIVQPISDENKLSEIRAITGWGEDVTARKTWEVVDGQQRLTSLYIIYRYLIEKQTITSVEIEDGEFETYNICYETRPETKEFLENLSSKTLSQENIDLWYITNAYNAIQEWFDIKGPVISEQYHRRSKPSDIRKMLADILRNTRKDSSESAGSAQFIWYELNDKSGKNPIDEFVSINNGKIRLTDAELIKGLFLQKRNFTSDRYGEQMKIAMQWESIENTLHQNDFWNFLSSSDDTDNRIELLFTLMYQQDNKGELPKDGNLFRYYYSKLTTQTGEELETLVVDEWARILQLFSVLQGWYEDPVLYNIVGFLIHSEVSLYEIVAINQNLPSSAEKNEFGKRLEELIAKQLPKKEDVAKGEISYKYNNTKKSTIRSLLLFLNIFMLNNQMAALRKKSRSLMTPVYKFPFDLYVSQSWDVEHIDSATQNTLNDVDDKLAMIKASMDTLGLHEDEEIKGWLSEDRPNYAAAWNKILQLGGGIGGDDTKKNDIGNLTLLDTETNRSYHNDIFARKRKFIQKVVQEGTFVPLCTQMIFNKGLENQNTDLRMWSDKDKDLYTDFILGQLKKFYNLKEDTVKQQTIELEDY